MLASSFLSADQLGLSTKQREALIDVLGRLERGELRHVNIDTDYGDFTVDHAFNMATFKCASVACIGGWADKLHKTDFRFLTRGMKLHDRHFMSLYTLLYGDLESMVELEDITVPQAGEALRNYLTTGDAQWVQVLGEA